MQRLQPVAVQPPPNCILRSPCFASVFLIPNDLLAAANVALYGGGCKLRKRLALSGSSGWALNQWVKPIVYPAPRAAHATAFTVRAPRQPALRDEAL